MLEQNVIVWYTLGNTDQWEKMPWQRCPAGEDITQRKCLPISSEVGREYRENPGLGYLRMDPAVAT